VYAYVHACSSGWMREVCVCAFTCIWVCVCACVCMVWADCVFTSGSVFLWCVCVCGWMDGCFFVCLLRGGVCVHVCVDGHISVWVCVCMCEWVGWYVFACVVSG